MQTENPLQNAYIGEYTGQYEYSYTFKWKTAQEIWNDRDLLAWTIQTNSNWLTWSSSTDCRIKKDIPSLASANIIIVTATIVGQNASDTATEIAIGKWTWWGNWQAGYQLYGSTYNGTKIRLSYNWTNYYWNVVWNPGSWTYNITLTVDLQNKLITWERTWFSNSTLVLSDAQVSDIRTYTYLVPYVSVNKSTVSDISISIEY